MWNRGRHLVLAVAVAAFLSGCGQKMSMTWWRREKKPTKPVVATTMPAGQAVRVFEDALALVTDLQYEQASAKFLSVVDPLDEAGDQRRASEAVFWLAYCREKLRYFDSASKLYQRLVEKYPKTVAAERGKQRLAALKGKGGGL